MKMTIKRTSKEEEIKYGDLIEIGEGIGIFHNLTSNGYLNFYSLKHKNLINQFVGNKNKIKKFYGEIILKNE